VKKLTIFFTFFFVITFDRVTKFLSLKYLLVLNNKEFIVNKFLNFNLAFNRGVSWSLFSFSNDYMFWALTTFIFIIIITFSTQVYSQYKKNESILFEIFVISGALSNIIDRFLYNAVVDFVELHIGNWYWPIFNIADVFIVLGIVGIFLKSVKNYVYKN
jgi:signal peptidase II